MATATNARPVSLADETIKTRSPLQEGLRQFRRNKTAMVSVFFILFMLFLAVTADFWRNEGFIENPITIHKASTPGSAIEAPMTCARDNPPGTPQYCFVFGSDLLHRDLLSRLVYGSRVSFAVAIVGTLVSLTIGLLYGVVAGYFGGKLDNIMMRIVDFLYGVPDLVLIILLQIYVKGLASDPKRYGPFAESLINFDHNLGGLFFIFLALGLLSWIGIARLVRGQVLSYKQKEFVEAARSVGASNRRIIFAHLLPNIIGPLIVIMALSIPGFIFTEAGLSFLNLGITPPTPSWGAMLGDAERASDQAAIHPQLVVVPGVTLALTTLAFNYIGEGLQDALDPKYRKK